MARTRLKSPGANADNPAVSGQKRTAAQRRAGSRVDRDNRPDLMDYVKLGAQTAGSSPTVEQSSTRDQGKRSQCGGRNAVELHVDSDRTIKSHSKRLVALRWEIHRRLAVIEDLAGRLERHRMALAELEVEERLLVYEMWQESPRKLAAVNDNTKRWRKRQ